MNDATLRALLEGRILACNRRLDMMREKDGIASVESAMTTGRRLAYQDILGTLENNSTLGTLTLIFTEQGKGFVEERRVSTQYSGDPIGAAGRLLESYGGYHVEILSVEKQEPFSRLTFRDLDGDEPIVVYAIITLPRGNSTG